MVPTEHTPLSGDHTEKVARYLQARCVPEIEPQPTPLINRCRYPLSLCRNRKLSKASLLPFYSL